MRKNFFLGLMSLIFVILLGVTQLTVQAQPSQSFVDAASAATASYNNVNLKCKEYAKTLNTFLKGNAATYGVKSFKHYRITVQDATNFPFIVHDSYKSGGEAISTNGVHIMTVVDGYVFDNLHPKGKQKQTWESQLHTPSGFKPHEDVTSSIQTIK